MSLIFVHLRWDDPGQNRYEEVLRAVPQDGDLPRGCLSRQLRRGAGALMATETWDSEASGGRMDQLAVALRAAGIDDAPQTAMFAMPAMFDIAYRRPGGAAADRAAPAAAAIPEQRGTSAGEQLLGSAEASTTVSG